MRILYVGDIMGEVGVEVIEALIKPLVQEKKIDLVIAQAENVSSGKGINEKDYIRLKSAGIDFFTGGNWTLNDVSILSQLSDPDQPIIRPANYPEGTPGLGYKYISINNKRVLVISLLGKIVGKDSDKPVDNPLSKVDEILQREKDTEKSAIIVNFHGDYSSEKVVIGHYLDGRVSAVVGDHWHVPTADARVLPNQTAHISDVGMCGALNSSLGVSYESILPRWKDGKQTRNILEDKGPRQFNAVLIDTNDSGLSNSIEQIQKIIE